MKFIILGCGSSMGVPRTDGFFGKLDFSQTLIPYQWNTDWIPSRLEEMIKTLNSEDIPLSNESCENCAYARERSIYDKIY